MLLKQMVLSMGDVVFLLNHQHHTDKLNFKLACRPLLSVLLWVKPSLYVPYTFPPQCMNFIRSRRKATRKVKTCPTPAALHIAAVSLTSVPSTSTSVPAAALVKTGSDGGAGSDAAFSVLHSAAVSLTSGPLTATCHGASMC